MDRQPMEFRLSAGTLASQIQLDQAACRSALKYVVPVLASVTQSQGQFSIQLDGCRIPIGDLNRAEIAGRIDRPFGHDEPRAAGRSSWPR